MVKDELGFQNKITVDNEALFSQEDKELFVLWDLVDIEILTNGFKRGDAGEKHKLEDLIWGNINCLLRR